MTRFRLAAISFTVWGGLGAAEPPPDPTRKCKVRKNHVYTGITCRSHRIQYVSIELPHRYVALVRNDQAVGTPEKGANTKALYTQLIAHLRERIIDGSLPPGA